MHKTATREAAFNQKSQLAAGNTEPALGLQPKVIEAVSVGVWETSPAAVDAGTAVSLQFERTRGY
jgi:hypothetical protein